MSIEITVERCGRAHRVFDIQNLDEIGQPLSTFISSLSTVQGQAIDLFVKQNDREELLTHADQYDMTLREALRRVSANDQLEGQKFVIDITVEHRGAMSLRQAPANAVAPRVFLSQSLVTSIERLCSIVNQSRLGQVEIPWLMAGETVDDRVYLLHAMVLPATCTSVSFDVTPFDLSSTNRTLAHSWPTLKTMGIAHRHPGTMSPRPSPTDVKDLEVINGLLHSLNLTPNNVEKRISATVDSDAGVITYRPYAGLDCSLALAGITEPPELIWREQWQTAYFAALIFDVTGKQPYAEVVENRVSPEPSREPCQYRHTDCVSTVLPDAAIAEALNLPLEAVQFTLDSETISQEIHKKLRAGYSYGDYYYASGYRTSLAGSALPNQSEVYQLPVSNTRKLPSRADLRGLILDLLEIWHADYPSNWLPRLCYQRKTTQVSTGQMLREISQALFVQANEIEQELKHVGHNST